MGQCNYYFHFVTVDGHIGIVNVNSGREIPKNLPFRSSDEDISTECLLCKGKSQKWNDCQEQNCPFYNFNFHAHCRELSDDEVGFITNFEFESHRELLSWITHCYSLKINPLPSLRMAYPKFTWKYIKGGWVEMQNHPAKNAVMISTTAISVEWGMQILTEEFAEQKEYPPIVDAVD